jgi:hypothetical protein
MIISRVCFGHVCTAVGLLSPQAIAKTLLLDSGVVCSRVVCESQLILRLLKNKGFKEERMTKVGLYAIG